MLFLWGLSAGCSPKVAPEVVGGSRIERGVPPVELAAAPVVVRAHPGHGPLTFSALIRAGSAYDPIGHEGTAWRTAHAVGSGEGAFKVAVGRERALVSLTCDGDGVACAERFGAALASPSFDEPELAALTQQARAELDERLPGDPGRLAEEVFVLSRYEGHRYGHPVEGRTGVLDVIDAADVRAFHAAHYVRQAVQVDVHGPLDEAVRRALDEALLALPGALPTELSLFAPPHVGAGAALWVGSPSGGEAGRIGAPAHIGWSHPDWPALWLGMTVLRRDLGEPLVVPPLVERRTYEDVLFAVPRGASEAQGIADVRRWAREGVAPDALEVTRAALRSAPGMDEALGAALDALTVEDVNAAIARHVDEQAFSVVLVGGLQTTAFIAVSRGASREPSPESLFR